MKNYSEYTEQFRKIPGCKNGSVNENEDVVTAVTSGISIKVNVDTAELDAAIRKAKYLIKLMGRINS